MLTVPLVGSLGSEVKYFSDAVRTDRSIRPVQVPAVAQAAVGVVVIVAGNVPLLSTVY